MRVVILSVLMLLSDLVFAFSMPEAINEAGRQRMLSQKIAKAYFMKSIKKDSTSAKSQLKNSVYQFEYNLKTLKESKLAVEMLPQLEDISMHWQLYKKVIANPISQENALQVLHYSELLLDKTHAYVTALEKVSGTQSAKLINVSGRQRMLSQRIAKNFLATYWGVVDPVIEDKYNFDLAEFENVLMYLLDNPTNTAEITKKLKRVKGQLTYANQAFDGQLKLSGARTMFVVTGTTDSMLQNMDDITRLYTSLSKR